jgi:hypothetical protein
MRPPSAPWPVRGGNGWRHPANMETNRQTPACRARDPSKGNSLPQGGEGPLPLPRGPRRCRGRGRRGRRRASNHLHRTRGLRRARTGPSVARAGASAARAASVVDCLVAGASASAPGDGSPATSAGSGDGGAGSHLSGRTCPLSSSSSSSSSSSDDEYSSVPGEESPCCSHSRNSSLLCSRRSRRRALRSLLRYTRSRSRRCAAHASARDRGVGGSDRVAFTRTICEGSGETLKRAINPKKRHSKKGSQEIHSPIGQREASRVPTGTRHHNAPA